MRANPPPQSGVQCLGQARTRRFICFYSVIEPAERESRRAPRGKAALPCFRTRFKAHFGIQSCLKVCCFFDPCHPGWLPFRFIFGSIFRPFWRPLGSILQHFGGFWRPLGVPGGVLGGGMFFHWFLEAKMVPKWSPRGSQNGPKSTQNGLKIQLFFNSFFGAFWVPKWNQNRSLKRSKSIKKWIKI